jgi:eukaryotic-like serine/threonine-protein kinase
VLRGPAPMAKAPPDAAATELDRGTSVGRYTILGLVGRGGMGDVYAAYDPDLNRRIALKLLRRGVGTGWERAQFQREAQVLAKVSHPNVVSVHDARTFEGRLFIAMEFVDGGTLRSWLDERRRSQNEILTVFIGAARGLAAAHAAGIIHRDFKPTNVMVGKDGRVRVTDFGLARPVHSEQGADGPPPNQGATQVIDLTLTGEVLGTPLYMAPEQFSGREADARTDQFNFCVALYQALYDVLPFGSPPLGTLKERVLAGNVEPPPQKTTVPSWLRAVLLRGLSVDPGDRWPSLDDLIVALRPKPDRRWSRLGVTAGALVLVALSGLALAQGLRSSAVSCLGGPARLAGVWEDVHEAPHVSRAAIEAAFLRTGVPGAREAWDRVAALLDRYRAEWLSMYRDSCEATHVRHEQPPSVLDLRMACLDNRRQAFAALSSVLVAADGNVVARAVDGANALPPIQRCGDRGQLEAQVEPPHDEATRKKVSDLRDRAATAKALNDTGKHEQAAGLLETLLKEARATRYQPLIAELVLARSRALQLRAFDPDFEATVQDAMWTALTIGRDDLAAEAAVSLVAVESLLTRLDEAHRWADTATVLIDRAGRGHEILRAWLLQNESVVALQQQEPARALELIDQTISLKETLLPPDHPDIGTSFNSKAEILERLGREDEALRANLRAHDIFVKAYGPASTEAAYTLSNRGEYLIAAGRADQALAPLREGLEKWEAQVGTDHGDLGYPLTALGRALLSLGRAKEALPALERALQLRLAHEHDASVIADTRFALARSLWDASRDHERALSLAREARTAYAAANDVKDLASVDGWIAVRRVR